MVENGADVNAQNKEGSTALMVACNVNNIEIVSYLLENDANPRLTTKKNLTAFKITTNDIIKDLLKNKIESILRKQFPEKKILQ